MTQNLKSELAALKRMTPAQLRDRYREVFGEPMRSGNKDFLVKRIAWRMQSLAEGGLSERAKLRAAELARDADIRMTTPRLAAPAPEAPARTVTGKAPPAGDGLPMPGAVITRVYRGKTIEVTVLPSGFEYDGQVYRSLSAVAQAVTGSHWNGRLFFGLKKQGGR